MGNIPRANTPPLVIDKTLSMEGAIAESKTVGTKINALNSAVTAHTNSINALNSTVSTLKSNLTASDNLQFKFGKDGDGNYGYYAADGSLVPFKQSQVLGIINGAVWYIRDKNGKVIQPTDSGAEVDTALTWVQLGSEGVSKTFTEYSLIRYGVTNKWVYKWLAPGTYSLGNGIFGDPASGATKYSYLAT